MTPGEKNILDTLNLLVFLLRSQTHIISITGKGERNIVHIDKEDLAKAGLSTPTFANTLELLTDKGYLISTPMIESKNYQMTKEIFDKIRDENVQILDQKLKDAVYKVSQKISPVNSQFNVDDFKHVSIKDMFEQTEKILKDGDKNSVSIVTLMPFRSIDRLLEKMNAGIPFDEIQDAEIWYDSAKYILHFGKETASTAYRGTPSRAHFILDVLLNKSRDLIIDYCEILEFDKNKPYSDSIRNLINKHPKLKKIFHVYSDHLEIDQKYKNDIH